MSSETPLQNAELDRVRQKMESRQRRSPATRSFPLLDPSVRVSRFVPPANVFIQIRASDERQSRKTKAKAPFKSCESIVTLGATLGSKLQ